MSLFLRDQSLEDQNPEEEVFYEFVLRLFKENKVEIATAITKPFPFLMGLRDRGFIPERMYNVSEGAFLLINSPSLYYYKIWDAMDRLRGSL